MARKTKPSRPDDPFYNLAGKNHGQNVRHLQYREAFVDALLDESMFQDLLYGRWTKDAGLPEKTQAIPEAMRQTANRHLVKLTLAFQLAYHRTFGLNFPWLAFALGEACYARYVSSAAEVELIREVRYRPRLAHGIQLTLREGSRREWARLKREGKTALRQANLPRGSIPSDDGTARRDARWLVKATIGCVPKRQLAREYSAAGDADAHAIVQQGIRRAKRYLSLTHLPK